MSDTSCSRLARRGAVIAALVLCTLAAAPACRNRSHSLRTLVLPPVTIIGPNWVWS